MSDFVKIVLGDKTELMVPANIAVQYEQLMEKASYFDRLQYVYKIKLNSSYGALTNYYFRFFRLDAGESTTGTGRAILRHQIRKVGEVLDGEYNFTPPVDVDMLERDPDTGDYRIVDHGEVDYSSVKFPSRSIVYGDTDSVAESSMIEWAVINDDHKEIELRSGTMRDMWEELNTLDCVRMEVHGYKEHMWFDIVETGTRVLTPTITSTGVEWLPVSFLYRHKVFDRNKWVITGEDGSSVTITGDHSLIVVRDNRFMAVRPSDVKDGDLLVKQKGN